MPSNSTPEYTQQTYSGPPVLIPGLEGGAGDGASLNPMGVPDQVNIPTARPPRTEVITRNPHDDIELATQTLQAEKEKQAELEASNTFAARQILDQAKGVFSHRFVGGNKAENGEKVFDAVIDLGNFDSNRARVIANKMASESKGQPVLFDAMNNKVVVFLNQEAYDKNKEKYGEYAVLALIKDTNTPSTEKVQRSLIAEVGRNIAMTSTFYRHANARVERIEKLYGKTDARATEGILHRTRTSLGLLGAKDLGKITVVDSETNGNVLKVKQIVNIGKDANGDYLHLQGLNPKEQEEYQKQQIEYFHRIGVATGGLDKGIKSLKYIWEQKGEFAGMTAGVLIDAIGTTSTLLAGASPAVLALVMSANPAEALLKSARQVNRYEISGRDFVKGIGFMTVGWGAGFLTGNVLNMPGILKLINDPNISPALKRMLANLIMRMAAAGAMGLGVAKYVEGNKNADVLSAYYMSMFSAGMAVESLISMLSPDLHNTLAKLLPEVQTKVAAAVTLTAEQVQRLGHNEPQHVASSTEHNTNINDNLAKGINNRGHQPNLPSGHQATGQGHVNDLHNNLPEIHRGNNAHAAQTQVNHQTVEAQQTQHAAANVSHAAVQENINQILRNDFQAGNTDIRLPANLLVDNPNTLPAGMVDAQGFVTVHRNTPFGSVWEAMMYERGVLRNGNPNIVLHTMAGAQDLYSHAAEIVNNNQPQFGNHNVAGATATPASASSITITAAPGSTTVIGSPGGLLNTPINPEWVAVGIGVLSLVGVGLVIADSNEIRRRDETTRRGLETERDEARNVAAIANRQIQGNQQRMQEMSQEIAELQRQVANGTRNADATQPTRTATRRAAQQPRTIEDLTQQVGALRRTVENLSSNPNPANQANINEALTTVVGLVSGMNESNRVANEAQVDRLTAQFNDAIDKITAQEREARESIENLARVVIDRDSVIIDQQIEAQRETMETFAEIMSEQVEAMVGVVAVVMALSREQPKEQGTSNRQSEPITVEPEDVRGTNIKEDNVEEADIIPEEEPTGGTGTGNVNPRTSQQNRVRRVSNSAARAVQGTTPNADLNRNYDGKIVASSSRKPSQTEEGGDQGAPQTQASPSKQTSTLSPIGTITSNRDGLTYRIGSQGLEVQNPDNFDEWTQATTNVPDDIQQAFNSNDLEGEKTAKSNVETITPNIPTNPGKIWNPLPPLRINGGEPPIVAANTAETVSEPTGNSGAQPQPAAVPPSDNTPPEKPGDKPVGNNAPKIEALQEDVVEQAGQLNIPQGLVDELNRWGDEHPLERRSLHINDFNDPSVNVDIQEMSPEAFRKYLDETVADRAGLPFESYQAVAAWEETLPATLDRSVIENYINANTQELRDLTPRELVARLRGIIVSPNPNQSNSQPNTNAGSSVEPAAVEPGVQPETPAPLSGLSSPNQSEGENSNKLVDGIPSNEPEPETGSFNNQGEAGPERTGIEGTETQLGIRTAEVPVAQLPQATDNTQQLNQLDAIYAKLLEGNGIRFDSLGESGVRLSEPDLEALALYMNNPEVTKADVSRRARELSSFNAALSESGLSPEQQGEIRELQAQYPDLDDIFLGVGLRRNTDRANIVNELREVLERQRQNGIEIEERKKASEPIITALGLTPALITIPPNDDQLEVIGRLRADPNYGQRVNEDAINAALNRTLSVGNFEDNLIQALGMGLNRVEVQSLGQGGGVISPSNKGENGILNGGEPAEGLLDLSLDLLSPIQLDYVNQIVSTDPRRAMAVADNYLRVNILNEFKGRNPISDDIEQSRKQSAEMVSLVDQLPLEQRIAFLNFVRERESGNFKMSRQEFINKINNDYLGKA